MHKVLLFISVDHKDVQQTMISSPRGWWPNRACIISLSMPMANRSNKSLIFCDLVPPAPITIIANWAFLLIYTEAHEIVHKPTSTRTVPSRKRLGGQKVMPINLQTGPKQYRQIKPSNLPQRWKELHYKRLSKDPIPLQLFCATIRFCQGCSHIY